VRVFRISYLFCAEIRKKEGGLNTGNAKRRNKQKIRTNQDKLFVFLNIIKRDGLQYSGTEI
jgi:hypothetical protein